MCDSRCRRNHSSLRLQRIESDAEHRCRNNCCRRNHSPLASIRKSGLEIKNRCRKLHVFRPSPAPTPARVHHALTTRLALDVLHGDGLDAGSAVAAKAGADAPGGGISLCFCRRGCAAPAKQAATLNDPPPQNQPKPPRSTTCRHKTNRSRHAQHPATLNGLFRKQKTGPR